MESNVSYAEVINNYGTFNSFNDSEKWECQWRLSCPCTANNSNLQQKNKIKKQKKTKTNKQKKPPS